MAILVCQQCGREVETTPFRLRSGQKYCSWECKQASTRTRLTPKRTETTCEMCGKSYIVPVAWLRQGRRKYCSKECADRHLETLTGEKAVRWGKKHSPESRDKMSVNRTFSHLAKKGPEHTQWKGGRYVHGGYVSVHIETLPEAEREMARKMRPQEGYILEHRLAMAMKLGRPLERREMVHHLNGDKVDNRPENLTVMEWDNHSRKHREIEREMAALRETNRRLTFLLLMCLRNGSGTST